MSHLLKNPTKGFPCIVNQEQDLFWGTPYYMYTFITDTTGADLD